MTSTKTFQRLMGSIVRTDGSVSILRFGDEVPMDLKAGEYERLNKLGAFTPRGEPEPETESESEALPLPTTPDELADWMRAEKPTISRVIEIVGDDAEMARTALTIDSEITGGEPRKGLELAMNEVINAASPPPQP